MLYYGLLLAYYLFGRCCQFAHHLDHHLRVLSRVVQHVSGGQGGSVEDELGRLLRLGRVAALFRQKLQTLNQRTTRKFQLKHATYIHTYIYRKSIFIITITKTSWRNTHLDNRMVGVDF